MTSSHRLKSRVSDKETQKQKVKIRLIKNFEIMGQPVYDEGEEIMVKRKEDGWLAGDSPYFFIRKDQAKEVSN